MITDAYKIHQLLVVAKSFWHIFKVGIFIADHNSLRVLQNHLDILHHEPRYMRNTIENEIAIGTNQTGDIYVLVIDAQVVAFADEPLDDFDHGAFAQVISPRLKAEAQDTNFLVPLIHDELYAPANLYLVAPQNRCKNRQF